MKRLLTLVILLVCAAAVASVFAKRKTQLEPSYAWRLEPPLGLRVPADIDTLPDNYARRSVPSEVSDAWATTGNLGGPGINMIFSERPALGRFFFDDAFAHWLPSYGKQRFYNTRIPMTLLSYNAGGGRDDGQDRLQATFSGNINARAQVGGMVDYLYSKGSYANQAAKDLAWGFSGSYLGPRYEMQAFFYHYNLVNKENGGITDPLYITDPALVQGGVTSVNAKNIPTRLSNAFTRLVGQQFYLNQRYKVGFWHEQRDSVTDTVTGRTYVPVTSFIWTLSYRDGRHIFRDDSPGETGNFFTNTYLYPGRTADRTSYWSLSNTFGISLLEGFNRYAKFGLAAFLTYDIVKYTQTPDSLDRTDLELTPFPEAITGIDPRHTENNITVGGQLTKQRGSILTYEATARFGITGQVAGDIDIDGRVRTRFPLFGDTVAITGVGSFSNKSAPYLMNNYLSNHFIWKNDFGKERRLAFGGNLDLDHTDSHLQIRAENIQNHLYFNSDFLPAQHGGSVQVFSARLQQNLRAGILHWDNSLTFQTSSDETVITLPKLAVYSNLYLKFRIATLFVQLGVDCDYYTRYYAPRYQPATATFANQHEQMLGNYPFMNVYANFKLSKARFYVLFSHINQGWFSKDYFSVVDYPLNPRRFQLGISVDFAN